MANSITGLAAPRGVGTAPRRIIVAFLLLVSIAVAAGVVFTLDMGIQAPTAETAGGGGEVDYGIRHLGATFQAPATQLGREADYGLRHLQAVSGPESLARSTDYGVRHLAGPPAVDFGSSVDYGVRHLDVRPE